MNHFDAILVSSDKVKPSDLSQFGCRRFTPSPQTVSQIWADLASCLVHKAVQQNNMYVENKRRNNIHYTEDQCRYRLKPTEISKKHLNKVQNRKRNFLQHSLNVLLVKYQITKTTENFNDLLTLQCQNFKLKSYLCFILLTVSHICCKIFSKRFLSLKPF